MYEKEKNNTTKTLTLIGLASRGEAREQFHWERKKNYCRRTSSWDYKWQLLKKQRNLNVFFQIITPVTQAAQCPFITCKTEIQEKNPKADQGLITREQAENEQLGKHRWREGMKTQIKASQKGWRAITRRSIIEEAEIMSQQRKQKG